MRGRADARAHTYDKVKASLLISDITICTYGKALALWGRRRGKEKQTFTSVRMQFIQLHVRYTGSGEGTIQMCSKISTALRDVVGLALHIVKLIERALLYCGLCTDCRALS